MNVRSTEDLIARLSASAEPVRRLQPPYVRATVWLVVVVPYLALLMSALFAGRANRLPIVTQAFVVEQVAAVATGVTAAIAAMVTLVPGYRRTVLLAPIGAGLVWAVAVSRECLAQMPSPDGALPEHWACVPATLVATVLPAAVMIVMLRRGAPLTPRLSTSLGVLAAGGLAHAGVRLVHRLDPGIVVLVWHLGTVFALSVAGAWIGRQLLRWPVFAGPAGTE